MVDINMPMDNRYDNIFYSKAMWYLKFTWVPQRCQLTNKLLWLCCAYKGTAVYTGPGSPVYEYRWIDKSQFLLARLKGQI
jgi:hypothetical protein